MTPLHEALGRRRRTLYVPAPGESVQQTPDRGAARPSDPPIYRELLRHWAGKGKTLPGHRDPEWARLTAPIVRPGEFGSGEPFGAVGAGMGSGARPTRQFTPGPGQFGESREARGQQFGDPREARGQQFGEPRDQYGEARSHYSESRESLGQFSEPRDQRGQFGETQASHSQFGETQASHSQFGETQASHGQFSETPAPRGDGR